VVIKLLNFKTWSEIAIPANYFVTGGTIKVPPCNYHRFGLLCSGNVHVFMNFHVSSQVLIGSIICLDSVSQHLLGFGVFGSVSINTALYIHHRKFVNLVHHWPDYKIILSPSTANDGLKYEPFASRRRQMRRYV